MSSLEGRTLFISGASRGIGLEIAKRAAEDGANIAFVAKTAEPHPKLPGTVYTAADEIREAGGEALPMVGDIRNEEDVARAVSETVERFGAIDICVNNASAIDLSNVEHLSLKRYDLMQDINTRGTFLVTKSCIPHLRGSDNPHILTLSPPLDLSQKWFIRHSGYTISKYGMTMLTLGLAGELADDGVAANTLWPRTYIATAAVKNLLGGEQALAKSRSPRIVADAAHAIVTRDSREATGNSYIDDEVLTEQGVTDLSHYSEGDPAGLELDIFLDR